MRAIEGWLELPEADRPPAFVVGAGNGAWHALEAGLARRGRALGRETGGHAAAGIASHGLTLGFGDALAYQGIEIDNLAALASPGLLDAILDGDLTERIVRYRPQLSVLSSLGLPLVNLRVPRDSPLIT